MLNTFKGVISTLHGVDQYRHFNSVKLNSHSELTLLILLWKDAFSEEMNKEIQREEGEMLSEKNEAQREDIRTSQ